MACCGGPTSPGCPPPAVYEEDGANSEGLPPLPNPEDLKKKKEEKTFVQKLTTGDLTDTKVLLAFIGIVGLVILLIYCYVKNKAGGGKKKREDEEEFLD